MPRGRRTERRSRSPRSRSSRFRVAAPAGPRVRRARWREFQHDDRARARTLRRDDRAREPDRHYDRLLDDRLADRRAHDSREPPR